MSNEPDDNIALLMDEIRRKAKEDVEISDAEVDRVIDYMRRQRAIAQATSKRPIKPKKPKVPKHTQLDLVDLIQSKG